MVHCAETTISSLCELKVSVADTRDCNHPLVKYRLVSCPRRTRAAGVQRFRTRAAGVQRFRTRAAFPDPGSWCTAFPDPGSWCTAFPDPGSWCTAFQRRCKLLGHRPSCVRGLSRIQRRNKRAPVGESD